MAEPRLRAYDVLFASHTYLSSTGFSSISDRTTVEFTADAVRQWLSCLAVHTFYIEPRSPWENGYNESFNEN